MTYGFDEFASFHKFYRPSGKKLLFQLDRDLMYRAQDGTVYVVPKTAPPSDLGSIPRLCWWLLPPHEFPSAYFLHDDLCNKVNRGKFSRRKADNLLREALIASHAPKWKTWLIYTGIRLYAKIKGIRN